MYVNFIKSGKLQSWSLGITVTWSYSTHLFFSLSVFVAAALIALKSFVTKICCPVCCYLGVLNMKMGS